MTALHDRLPTTHNLRGDEAIMTIDKYRDQAGEQFEVRPLDTEFAFYMHYLGATGIQLVDAANNRAGTFKWRGAMNKMARLNEQGITETRAASAGNHLAGGALASYVLGTTFHGIVPRNAPVQKTDRARRLNPDSSRFHLHVVGQTFDDANNWALNHPQLGVMIPPFDDPEVAAGQGTIVDDTLAAFDAMGVRLDRLVVPVGGGGLLAGVVERAAELAPHLQIDGVEAEGSESLSQSIKAGRIVEANHPNAKYGGSAVKRTGRHTLATLRGRANAHLWGASDEEVRDLVDLYEEEILYRELNKCPDFTPFEPTTLVAIAGLKSIVSEHPNQTIAVVGTGRNDRLDTVWR